MKQISLLFVICYALLSVDVSAQETNQWFPSSIQPARGAALVVHGLNFKPSRMSSVVDVFQKEGYDVLRVVLAGHRGDPEEAKKVTADIWRSEVAVGYKQVRSKAGKGAVVFAGFSLGGLLGELLINLGDAVRDAGAPDRPAFDRVVLFAPAISILARSHLVRLLGIFGRDFVVPSAGPEVYRANISGLPMAAYTACFDLLNAQEKAGYAAGSKIPTLVFVDAEDPLVSSTGIREIFEANHLTNWKRVLVSKTGTAANKVNHHLVIDEDTMGKEAWRAMVDQIHDHLN